ncbi:MAG TPA: hypothetical protein VHY22_03200, partial [Chthoniobacteraceae bacterium]|nr:hypothetical protein [Chthoniobacteraceae bacterium]
MWSLHGFKILPIKPLLACAFAAGLALSAVHAETPQPIRTVFYILLENRNFTSGTSLAAYDASGGSVVFGNPAAPYINSLVSGS